MGIILLFTGKRRSEAVVHQAQGGAVCEPHAVADVVHPFFLDLSVGRIHAILFHHHQIDIFDIGVVIGESAVDGRHLAHGLVEHEGTLAGFVHELVLVFETIYVADHLAYPGAGDLVLEFAAADLFLLTAGCHDQQGG